MNIIRGDLIGEAQRAESRLSDWERKIEGYSNECYYPDYNAWVKALENDPQYLKKREQELKDLVF